MIASPRGLDFDALQMRLHPAASRAAKLARETPAAFVGFDLLADGRAGHSMRPAAGASREARSAARAASSRRSTSRRSRAIERLASRVARSLRGRGARRRHREADRRAVRAGQARHAQSEARAHGGLRGGRLPLAQEWTRCGRLPAARTVRREGPPSARWRDLRLHDGQATRARDRAGATARACARRSSLAGVGHRERRVRAHARRAEPVERRQGSLLGAAARRAGLRGQVRPSAGIEVPARGRVPALASRQAPRRLHDTTSSRSRPLTSSRRSSVPGATGA